MLVRPALADTVITLSSGGPSASVPASVTVPAGMTTANFTITGNPVAADTPVAINASLNGATAITGVTVLAPQLASVSVSPTTVWPGSTSTGTVTLTGPAAANVTVALSSGNTAEATVPASVTVTTGNASATFQIQSINNAPDANVTISATLNTITRTSTLTIHGPQLSVSISPSSVTSGHTATGTVTLTPAPAANAAVSLSANQPDATVPPQTTILAGATTATFTITTAIQQGTYGMPVTITATAGGASGHADLIVYPPALLSFTVTPSDLTGGTTSIGTATIDFPAPPTGKPIWFQTDGCQMFDYSSFTGLIIPAQATSVQVPVITGPVSSVQTAIVMARPQEQGYPIGAQSAPLTVRPATVTLNTLTLSPATVTASNDVTGTVTLTAAAPTGGVEIDLKNYAGSVTMPAFVRVPAGSTSATFTIKTASTASGPFTITASHSVTSKTATLTVNAPTGVYLASLQGNSLMVAGTSQTATVGMSANVTAGGGASVALSSNVAGVTVPSSVSVKKNTSSQTFTITASSTITSPVAATITASYAGVIQRLRVTVNPPNGVSVQSISVTHNPNNDYHFWDGTVTLNNTAPTGGAVVTLAGSRSSLVTVPATVTVPAGATSATFTVTQSPFLAVQDRGTDVSATYHGVTVSTTIYFLKNGTCALLERTQPVQCASAALAPCLDAIAYEAIESIGAITAQDAAPANLSRYYLYTPELQLMAETDETSGATKPISYTYLWFAGMPVASIEAATNTTRWYATDHLGTPLLMTDAAGAVAWRAEYAPYGAVHSIRAGSSVHQPLRFPGQVALDGTDAYYNVYRHYRSSWGRYTQVDPAYRITGQAYAYASDAPLRESDPLGLWGVRHSEKVRPTIQTNTLCGSPIACSRVSVRVECKCSSPNYDCDPTFPEPTLVLEGNIFVNPAFRGKAVATVDPNVRDFRSAVNHEYNFHIDKALDAVSDLMDTLERSEYSSPDSCRRGCAAMNPFIYDRFNQVLHETQQFEVRQAQH
jgi:RHS repeat-associated protein